MDTPYILCRNQIVNALEVKVPFTINLQDHTKPVIFEKILRIKKGERMTGFGKWAEKEVLIKIFCHVKKFKKDFDNEYRGVSILTHEGIKTPFLCYTGKIANQNICVLIFEKIPASFNLFELWKSIELMLLSRKMIQKVITFLAYQHQKGILQEDLNPENILLTTDEMYMIDGARITKHKHPISKKISLKYIATFLAGFLITPKSEEQFFTVYAKARGWLINSAEIKRYHQMRVARKMKRWLHYLKKYHLHDTYFGTLENEKQSVIYNKKMTTDKIKQLLNIDFEYILAQPATLLIKKSKYAQYFSVHWDNEKYIIKRYYHPMKFYLNGSKQFISSAMKIFRYSHCLPLIDIKTVLPIACIEPKLSTWNKISFLILSQADNISNTVSIPGIESAKNIDSIADGESITDIESIADRESITDIESIADRETITDIESIAEIEKPSVNHQINQIVQNLREIGLNHITHLQDHFCLINGSPFLYNLDNF